MKVSKRLGVMLIAGIAVVGGVTRRTVRRCAVGIYNSASTGDASLATHLPGGIVLLV